MPRNLLRCLWLTAFMLPVLALGQERSSHGRGADRGPAEPRTEAHGAAPESMFSGVARLYRMLAQAPTVTAPASPVPAAAADIPPPPRFDIERFDVQGNTVLRPAEVAAAVAPYEGKNKDFADVQRALEALQARYEARGYGVVQVLLPEQELERGVIVLRVIEPKLGSVTVDGNKFFSEDNIRRSFPAVQEGQTPNSAEIGRNARLANENPSKRASVVLRAGKAENALDATIRVEDEKFWRAAVSLDNTGSPTFSRYRLGFGFQHGNLFDRDHTLTMQYIMSPEHLSRWDEFRIVGLGYRIPLYAQGDSLEFLAGYSDAGSAVVQGAPGLDFNVSGSGKIAVARYNHTLPRPAFEAFRDYDHRISFGLEYKAFSPRVTDTGAFGNQQFATDVTVHPFTIAYTGQKRMDNAELALVASVSHNFYPHGHNANRQKFTDPEPPVGEGAARGVGRPTYTVWRYGLNYARLLPRDFQLRAALSGQYSRDALIAGEQFGIGGADSIRGMEERESANDRGYRWSFELYSPDVATNMKMEWARLRFLAFYEGGRLNQNFKPAACIDLRCGLSAASVGLGLRMSTRQGFNLRLDYGRVVDGGVVSPRNRDRVHFGMVVAF